QLLDSAQAEFAAAISARSPPRPLGKTKPPATLARLLRRASRSLAIPCRAAFSERWPRAFRGLLHRCVERASEMRPPFPPGAPVQSPQLAGVHSCCLSI